MKKNILIVAAILAIIIFQSLFTVILVNNAKESIINEIKLDKPKNDVIEKGFEESTEYLNQKVYRDTGEKLYVNGEEITDKEEIEKYKKEMQEKREQLKEDIKKMNDEMEADFKKMRERFDHFENSIFDS